MNLSDNFFVIYLYLFINYIYYIIYYINNKKNNKDLNLKKLKNFIKDIFLNKMKFYIHIFIYYCNMILFVEINSVIAIYIGLNLVQ